MEAEKGIRGGKFVVKDGCLTGGLRRAVGREPSVYACEAAASGVWAGIY